ncbi:MAG: hypothetical protein OHK0039_29690 [Bacteroidia bacterium]
MACNIISDSKSDYAMPKHRPFQPFAYLLVDEAVERFLHEQNEQNHFSIMATLETLWVSRSYPPQFLYTPSGWPHLLQSDIPTDDSDGIFLLSFIAPRQTLYVATASSWAANADGVAAYLAAMQKRGDYYANL